MATAAPTKSPASSGVISPGDLYTLAEAQQRSGLGEWAFRQARRKGLKVIRRHGRAFVSGAELVRYLSESAE